MDRAKASKKANKENIEELDADLKMKMVSKTTFKLRSSEALTASEHDSGLMDDFELMEIPLSPTHYQQPPTPDHAPPSALEAENTIVKVLDAIRMVISRV